MPQSSLDHPMVKFFVIAVTSAVLAHIFWMLSGSMAKVVAEEGTIWGFGIELGGSIAGFVVVYWVSLHVVDRLHRLPAGRVESRCVKVYLIPREKFEQGKPEDYSAHVTIFNSDTGEYRDLPLRAHRENGHLTLNLKDLENTDFFSVRVRDLKENIWSSEDQQITTAKVEMKKV